MNELLRIENLHKYFGELHVLKGVDLTVQKGEAIVIIGSSGSGKSTILRCVNFLEIPSDGNIYLKGKLITKSTKKRKGRTFYKESDLCEIRKQIGMVFQQFNLFPHMTVLQNTMEGLVSVLKIPKQEATRKAFKNLKEVGLTDKADEYPSRLSGGQQQRVAIARALAMEPDIMLFDEVTSALDPELVGEVLRTIRSLKRIGMTMLIVTHELGFAYAVADQVVFIHEGLIHEQGSPKEVLLKPKRQRTKEFLSGHSQFIIPVTEAQS